MASSGETVSSGKGGKRVNGEALKNAIVQIVAEAKDGISAADIMKHSKLVALYQTVNKPVAQQAQILAKMVEAKELKKTGTGKASRYHP